VQGAPGSDESFESINILKRCLSFAAGTIPVTCGVAPSGVLSFAIQFDLARDIGLSLVYVIRSVEHRGEVSIGRRKGLSDIIDVEMANISTGASLDEGCLPFAGILQVSAYMQSNTVHCERSGT
jgi:hypothetical protein